MSDRLSTPVIALAGIACSGLALIVCGIGAFGLALLVQGSSAPDVTDGSRGPAVSEQPADQLGAEERPVEQAGWWTGAQADAACTMLAGAFSGYSVTYAAGSTQLTCEYGSPTTEAGMIAARIEITGFATAEAARQDWLSEFGPDSDFARTWAELQGQGFVYTPEADRYFLSFSQAHAGKIAYKNQGGWLYQNAVIVFDQTEAADAGTTTWQRVQDSARQLVDQKNGR